MWNFCLFVFLGQELDTGEDGNRGGEDNSGNSDQVLKPSPSENNQVPGKQLVLIGEGSVKPLFITMSHVLAKMFPNTIHQCAKKYL